MRMRNLLIGMVGCVALAISAGSSDSQIDPNSIVAIYLFDNDDPDVVIDSGENGFDAEITGGPKWVDGRYGQAIELDGATYADVIAEDQDAFTMPVFTVAAWVGNMKVAGHQYVLHKSTGGGDRNYIMNVQDGTGFFVSGFSQGGTWNAVVSQTNVADGKWHHLVATYDGDVVRIYADGVLETERALAGPPAENNAGFRIGRGPAQSFPFTGQIDEILIANAALSEANINAMMNNGLEKSALNVDFSGEKLATTWSKVKMWR